MKPTLNSLRSTWKTPTVDALPNTEGRDTIGTLKAKTGTQDNRLYPPTPYPFPEADFDVFGDFTIRPHVGC